MPRRLARSSMASVPWRMAAAPGRDGAWGNECDSADETRRQDGAEAGSSRRAGPCRRQPIGPRHRAATHAAPKGTLGAPGLGDGKGATPSRGAAKENAVSPHVAAMSMPGYAARFGLGAKGRSKRRSGTGCRRSGGRNAAAQLCSRLLAATLRPATRQSASWSAASVPGVPRSATMLIWSAPGSIR